MMRISQALPVKSAISRWQDAIDWQSDGIQTDHPEELIAFLNK